MTTESPYAVNPLPPETATQSTIDESQIFVNWLLFFLVSVIGGAVAGAVGGGIVGGLLGAVGQPMRAIQIASGVAGFVLGLPVSYLTYRWTVKRLMALK